MLSIQMTFQVGVQMGVAVVPYGREAEAGVNVAGSGVNITYSYTIEKGAMLNIGRGRELKQCMRSLLMSK
jgi:lipid-binding SYLF domain-containing protein